MKKLLSLLLAGIMCSAPFSLVGCKDKDETETNKIVFADFEKWAPNFQTMAVYNRFGRITRNTDKKYVKNGEASARLQPVGGRVTETQPYFVMPVKSEKFEYDYSDFTWFEEVSAYLYNASDKAITMTFGLVSAYSSDAATTLVGEKIKLEPNEWTRASYVVDWSFLSIAGDPTAIAGIYFQFPDMGVEYPEDAPDIYLDDVVFTKAATQGEATATLDLTKTDTTAEICDFEKLWQRYAYKATTVEGESSVEVVKASEYGIEASSGENVLRVLRSNGASAANVSIPGQLFKAAGIADIPEEEWASTYFCFDMYNNHATKNQYHAPWFAKEGGKNNYNPKKWKGPNAEGEYDWDGYYSWPRPTNLKWYTYKISLWEISQGLKDKDYILKIGQFALTFATDNTGEEWEVFLDNFRLERGEKIAGVS